jgi:hypothetical protein
MKTPTRTSTTRLDRANRPKHRGATIIATLVAACLLSACGKEAAETSAGGDPSEYTVAAFGYHDPNPADFNPLNGEAVLLRRDETAFFASTGSGVYGGFAFDDAGQSFNDLQASPAGALAGITDLFDVTSANVDDDPNIEVVAVGNTANGLAIRVVDSDAHGVFDGQGGFSITDQSFTHAQVRAADVDGDGRAEILIVGETASGVVARLYDDATANFKLLAEVYSGPGLEIAAAFGNFDADPQPELALLVDEGTDVKLTVLDDAKAAFKPLEQLSNTSLGLPATWTTYGLRLETGNFDGTDIQDEIAVLVDGYDTGGDQSASGNLNGVQLAYVDDALAGFVTSGKQQVLSTAGSWVRNGTNYRASAGWSWQTLATDSNGNGTAEIFLLGQTIDDSGARAWTLSALLSGQDAGATKAGAAPAADGGTNAGGGSPTGSNSWLTGGTSVTLAKGLPSGTSASLTVAAGRDANCQPQGPDCGADLMVALVNGGALTPYHVSAIIPTGQTKYSLSSAALAAPALPVLNGVAWAIGGDYDADSLRVRFTGQKTPELTNPKPFVVLAAPPAKAGISQDYGDTTSSYSVQSGLATSDMQAYKMSQSVTLSADVAIPETMISFGASASVGRALETSNTTTTTTSYGTSYSATYPDNVVIFNGTLAMRYQYVVTGGNSTSDPVGTRFTVDVPVGSRIYKWNVDNYNQFVGSDGPQISSDILPQTVGDPSTFPTPDQRDAILNRNLNSSWAQGLSTVGFDNSHSGLKIQLSTEATSEQALTYSVGASASLGLLFTATYSQTYDSTSSYSISVNQDTEYDASVGDISAQDDITNWGYSWGMFVYPTTLAHGQPIQVVQFWTQDLGAGYGAAN